MKLGLARTDRRPKSRSTQEEGLEDPHYNLVKYTVLVTKKIIIVGKQYREPSSPCATQALGWSISFY